MDPTPYATGVTFITLRVCAESAQTAGGKDTPHSFAEPLPKPLSLSRLSAHPQPLVLAVLAMVVAGRGISGGIARGRETSRGVE